jgi:hypothetical protein
MPDGILSLSMVEGIAALNGRAALAAEQVAQSLLSQLFGS